MTDTEKVVLANRILCSTQYMTDDEIRVMCEATKTVLMFGIEDEVQEPEGGAEDAD